MLTLDDLKKLRGIIRDEVDKRAEETELKMELRFNSVDKRFEGVDKRFNSIDKRFDRIEEQMKQDRKDWSEFFNQAGIFFDDMRNQLVKRIKKIEDKQGIPKN